MNKMKRAHMESKWNTLAAKLCLVLEKNITGKALGLN